MHTIGVPSAGLARLMVPWFESVSPVFAASFPFPKVGARQVLPEVAYFVAFVGPRINFYARRSKDRRVPFQRKAGAITGA